MSEQNKFDFDLFVIGAGSGGVRAARMAAQTGARVAAAEGAPLGGTCVNLGCIPKKLYSYAAHYAEAFEESHGYGWEGEKPVLNWETLKRQRATEISRLNGVYENLFKGAGVELIRGWATLQDPHTVTLDNGQSYTAKYILIATGGRPAVPDVPGKEYVITSNEIFDLPEFPQRLLVVGGGYIACEFASIFNGLGAHVTQLYRSEQVLRGFDREIRDFVAGEMRKAGVDLRVNANIASIEKTGEGLKATLEDGSVLLTDQILYATGRAPNIKGLGFEALGGEIAKNGAIKVNERYQTSISSIFALGDVTDRIQLTPVALAEAMVLVDDLFGKKQKTMSYEYIPTAVFTHPNIGTVGYSEEDAREKFGQIRVFRSEFRPLKHTLSGSSARVFMKLIVDVATDKVVGMHMVGDDAGEIIQGFAVAVKAGVTKAVFDSTIGIHPTAAEEFVTMRG
ncbi:glutathione-disulfide reductase [Advenella alkanexedens]|uniref:Glutathione reductase n=1 Tax=Advenella alkanexedens TaxID=1481665 RepID=A0ABS6NR45_9BURK|nr:glutathione-disulfide reductase [Advenella alkanexedens]MBV4398073.1 glutathione-disulfide reductase [Advenella alkanexedens]